MVNNEENNEPNKELNGQDEPKEPQKPSQYQNFRKSLNTDRMANEGAGAVGFKLPKSAAVLSVIVALVVLLLPLMLPKNVKNQQRVSVQSQNQNEVQQNSKENVPDGEFYQGINGVENAAPQNRVENGYRTDENESEKQAQAEFLKALQSRKNPLSMQQNRQNDQANVPNNTPLPQLEPIGSDETTYQQRAAAPKYQAPTRISDVGGYARELERAIKSNWNPPNDGVKQPIVIYMHIESNGTIATRGVVKSSGDASLDQTAMHAIEMAVPQVPYPTGGGNNGLNIDFTFDYDNVSASYKNAF